VDGLVDLVLDARFDALGHAGDAYDTLSTAFGGHVSEVEAVGAGCTRAWTGQAASIAQTALAAQHTQLAAAHSEMLTIGSLLHEAAAAFTAAQNQLTSALEAARAANCTVDPDGTVTGPTVTTAEHHDPDTVARNSAAVQSVADLISKALQAATTADEQYATRLNTLAAHARDGSGLTAATSAADLKSQYPGPGAGPAAVKSWWQTLSAAEQQIYIHDQPGLIGNWDGIPVVARDQANRLNLPNLINQHETKPQPLSDIDKRKLDGFIAIQTKLDSLQGTIPPPYLIGLNDQGQGHGILSYGNPDTATNICSYVPDMGTTLADIAGGDGQRALDLWNAATQAPGSASTASLVWLGYDPPPGPPTSLGTVNPAALEAAGTARAQSGAVSYDQFMNGLRATHDGPPAHLTALGHSYGSLTVGMAAQLPGGTHANDIILIGSPGTQAAHADQLGVPANHVWVGAADHDPVTYLPSKAEVATGALLPGAEPIVVAADPNQRWFGPDPASAEFGANRFQVAPGPYGIAAHSMYLNPGSLSMDNITKVVNGNYSKVKLVPQR
jgi:hypothetical protein